MLVELRKFGLCDRVKVQKPKAGSQNDASNMKAKRGRLFCEGPSNMYE